MIHLYQKFGLILLAFAFFLNLISVPNIGFQAGIKASYNVGVYAGILFFILITTYLSLKSRSFYYSPLIKYAFVLVFMLPFIGWLNSDWKSIEYTFYALLVGWLFLLALTQYQFNKKHWYWFFYAISLLGLIQICISLIQRFDHFAIFYWWVGYFPLKFHVGYLGSFQQPNMLASFLSFSVVLSFWLVLQKRFVRHQFLVQLPIFLTIFLGIFIVFSSGSRAGVLGGLIGLILIFIALKNVIKTTSKEFLLALFFAGSGLLLAYVFPADFASVTNKLARVVYGGDIRLFLYNTGWHIFLENFWFGVGIGHYSASLQEYIMNHALYLDRRIVNFDIRRFTHPHNELLFWMIQVGFIGSIAWLTAVYLVLRNWWKQGKGRFILYLGLSFPLWLQVLVSYPFTLSATHYFLFLTMVFFSLKLPLKKARYCASLSTIYFARASIVLLLIWLFYYMYVLLMSSFEFYYFKNRLFFYKVYPEQEKIGYFDNASSSVLYHKSVLDNMEHLVVRALPIGNHYDMNQYLLWYNKQNKQTLPTRFHKYASEAQAQLK